MSQVIKVLEQGVVLLKKGQLKQVAAKASELATIALDEDPSNQFAQTLQTSARSLQESAVDAPLPALASPILKKGIPELPDYPPPTSDLLNLWKALQELNVWLKANQDAGDADVSMVRKYYDEYIAGLANYAQAFKKDRTRSLKVVSAIEPPSHIDPAKVPDAPRGAKEAWDQLQQFYSQLLEEQGLTQLRVEGNRAIRNSSRNTDYVSKLEKYNKALAGYKIIVKDWKGSNRVKASQMKLFADVDAALALPLTPPPLRSGFEKVQQNYDELIRLKSALSESGDLYDLKAFKDAYGAYNVKENAPKAIETPGLRNSLLPEQPRAFPMPNVNLSSSNAYVPPPLPRANETPEEKKERVEKLLIGIFKEFTKANNRPVTLLRSKLSEPEYANITLDYWNSLRKNVRKANLEELVKGKINEDFFINNYLINPFKFTSPRAIKTPGLRNALLPPEKPLAFPEPSVNLSSSRAYEPPPLPLSAANSVAANLASIEFSPPPPKNPFVNSSELRNAIARRANPFNPGLNLQSEDRELARNSTAKEAGYNSSQQQEEDNAEFNGMQHIVRNPASSLESLTAIGSSIKEKLTEFASKPRLALRYSTLQQRLTAEITKRESAQRAIKKTVGEAAAAAASERKATALKTRLQAVVDTSRPGARIANPLYNKRGGTRKNKRKGPGNRKTRSV